MTKSKEAIKRSWEENLLIPGLEQTGIYAGDELIEFVYIILPNSQIYVPLPKRFVVMPDVIKNVKYPSMFAPEFIMSSLDVTVNFGFNQLKINDGDVRSMCIQFQAALKNINPSISIRKQAEDKTCQNKEMIWFEYYGFQLDGQSYNRVCLIKMKYSILHVVFSCPLEDKENWVIIIEQIFISIKEEL